MISEGSYNTEDWWSWKLSFAITGINYILKYINIENNVAIFTVLLWSNKCNLGEKKRHLY